MIEDETAKPRASALGTPWRQRKCEVAYGCESSAKRRRDDADSG